MIFKPFSSKVGDYDCKEMKTLFRKSCHVTVVCFRRKGGKWTGKITDSNNVLI